MHLYLNLIICCTLARQASSAITVRMAGSNPGDVVRAVHEGPGLVCPDHLHDNSKSSSHAKNPVPILNSSRDIGQNVS